MLKDSFKSNWQVRAPGSVGLGTMMMGWRLGPKESEKILSLAYENGIVFIDTSVSYSRGLCHQIISNALINLKLVNHFYIATKVGGISNDNDPPEHRGYSKKNIIRQCNLSLAQLQLDYINLLQLHNPPDNLEYEEVFEALSILKDQGKIIDYGICNLDEVKIRDFLNYARKNNFADPFTCQFEYNLINANEKASMFKFLEAVGIKTLTWGPLSSGLLTDWYLNNTYLRPNSRLATGRERDSKKNILHKTSTKDLLKRLGKLCLNFNIPAQVFSVLWILKNNPSNLPLLGPSSIDQFSQLVTGMRSFTLENLDFISFDAEFK